MPLLLQVVQVPECNLYYPSSLLRFGPTDTDAYTGSFCFDGIEIILVLPVSQIDFWNDLTKKHAFEIPHKVVEGGSARFPPLITDRLHRR